MLNKEIYELQNENLKQQLTEKEKEIEGLKDFHEFEKDLMFDGIKILTKQKEQEIRHQVCEEIRKFIDNNEHSEENEAKQSSESVVYTKQLYNLLDQIEKGERK